MNYPVKIFFTVALCLLIICCLTSCNEKQKVGTLQISQTKFSLEKDSQKTTISLNVKGKIKNTSPYDIKNIVITGRCESCSEEMHAGKWFVTQQVKREDQKAIINYLPAGAEQSFSFDGIAYFFRSSTVEMPEAYPEDLVVYVTSFETIQE